MQEMANQGVASADPSSSETSTEGLQSTSSAEDLPVTRPDPVSPAEESHPDLPRWARRAPRSGWARPSTDRAGVGALQAH